MRRILLGVPAHHLLQALYFPMSFVEGCCSMSVCRCIRQSACGLPQHQSSHAYAANSHTSCLPYNGSTQAHELLIAPPHTMCIMLRMAYAAAINRHEPARSLPCLLPMTISMQVKTQEALPCKGAAAERGAAT